MTTIIDGSAGVTFPAGGNPQAAPSKVLQVVNAVYSTSVSSSTSTFIDTGLTASITPLFSTSKILILVSQNGCYKDNAHTDNCLDIRLLNGSSAIITFAGALATTSSLLEQNTSASTCYLDSPATTSSVTYKTQFRSRNGQSSVTVQFASVSSSTITLMEIAA